MEQCLITFSQRKWFSANDEGPRHKPGYSMMRNITARSKDFQHRTCCCKASKAVHVASYCKSEPNEKSDDKSQRICRAMVSESSGQGHVTITSVDFQHILKDT